MPIDRKALMAKMKQERAEREQKCKQIVFPLPDLNGPHGNASYLLIEAEGLIKDAGLSDTLFDEFRGQATKGGGFLDLLDTIQEWFTVATRDTTYTPIPEGVDIKSFMDVPDDLSWDDVDPERVTDAEVTEALEDYAAKADEDRRVADLQAKINNDIRKELGLSDDEVVIVQIKKTKK